MARSPKVVVHSEANGEVMRKEPCPHCHSKDNLVRYMDGHAHCFTPGCGHHEPPVGGHEEVLQFREPPTSAKASAHFVHPDHPGAFDALAKRRITSDTLRRFGYFSGTYSGQAAQFAPYYDQQGNLVAQKVRLPDKSFPTIKLPATSMPDCKLFGQQFFGERFDRKVVITEGEIDAMTVAQVTGFKFPVVSVGTGAAGAAKSLQANYRWVDNFAEIILWFDNDAPGKLASEECAKLFKVGKVRLASLADFKDASDALQANRPGDIEAALYSAVTWRPAGIINPADCFEDIKATTEGIPAWDWPWAGLNDMTRGIRLAEVTYLVSGTGMGKTTIIHQTVDQLLRQDNKPNIPARAKVGIMCFEDTRGDVQVGLLSVFLKQRLVLKPLPEDKLRSAHTDLFGKRRIEMFDPETAEWDFESIMHYVRYMAKGLECNVIFIDPLSFIAAGLEGQQDERRALDRVARDFAKLAKELNIAIIVTHHLTRPPGEKGHEEGATIHLKELRGSGGPANFSSTIIGIEGNQQGSEPQRRRYRVLKNRRIGTTGVAGCVDYDPLAAIMTETEGDIPGEDESDGGQRPSPSFPRF